MGPRLSGTEFPPTVEPLERCYVVLETLREWSKREPRLLSFVAPLETGLAEAVELAAQCRVPEDAAATIARLADRLEGYLRGER